MDINTIDLKTVNPKRFLLVGILIIFLIYLLLGGPFFVVAPDEEGVVLTLGRYSHTTGPGFQMKLPWPFQSVTKVAVTKVQRLEVGFRTIDPGPPATYLDFRNSEEMRHEAQMLTGDENIISSDLMVQWRIKDSAAYLFNVKNPIDTLRDITESVERQVVGDYSIDYVLTTGKSQIQAEIQQQVQELCDMYGLGISVQSVLLGDLQPPMAVAQAFKDVATAKEDKSKIINEAKGYQNEKIPDARGKAAKMINEGKGYAASRVKRSQGDAARFVAIAREYRKARDITEKRLYLETMAEILPRMEKVLFDEKGQVVNVNGLTLGGK